MKNAPFLKSNIQEKRRESVCFKIQYLGKRRESIRFKIQYPGKT